MKEKKGFFYTLIIVLSLFISWTAFFFVPKFVEWRAMNNETDRYRLKIAGADKTEVKIKGLEKELERLGIDAGRMRKKLFPYAQKNDIATIIQKQFDTYNIRVVNISPVLQSFLSVNKDTSDTAFKRLPTEIELVADFMDFAHLLENVHELPFYIHPDQLYMKKSGSDSHRLAVNFKASLFISTKEEL